MACGRRLPPNLQAGEAVPQNRRERLTGARRRLRLGLEEDSQEEEMEEVEGGQEEVVPVVEEEGEWMADNPGLLGSWVPT